jgi:hypothetical protein
LSETTARSFFRHFFTPWPTSPRSSKRFSCVRPPTSTAGKTATLAAVNSGRDRTTPKPSSPKKRELRDLEAAETKAIFTKLKQKQATAVLLNAPG